MKVEVIGILEIKRTFEILSAALDEAIEDAKSDNKKLERHEVSLELKTTEMKSNKTGALEFKTAKKYNSLVG